MNHGDIDAMDRPLFGAPRSSDRAINLVVGVMTGLIVLVTLISAFVFPVNENPNVINISFAVVICFILCSHLILIYWYRQGDLEPRFRNMILFNAFNIMLLCIVGNLYIHNIDKSSKN